MNTLFMTILFIIVVVSVILDAVVLYVVLYRSNTLPEPEPPTPVPGIETRPHKMKSDSAKELARGIGAALLKHGEKQTDLINYIHGRAHEQRNALQTLAFKQEAILALIKSLHIKLVGPLPEEPV